MTEPPTIAVLGAGSWGTALALHLSELGGPVRLWSRTEEHAEAMARARQNERYLPGFTFSPQVTVTASLTVALTDAQLVVLAIPSHGMRASVRRVRAWFDEHPGPAPVYLVVSKGLEIDTLATMHDVLCEELPPSHTGQIACLGGPSFAPEVARKLPTTVVVAARDPSVARTVQGWISGPSLRAYVTDDVVGVELGGAFKNIIALAAGIGDGAGLGLNARAGMITRGLAEITRLAVALGADAATLAGLAGVGDLVLTCTGGLSRNRRVGLALGEGRTLDQALEEIGMVAEGVKTTAAAHRLARREGVEMPIVSVIHKILYEGWSVSQAVDGLMGRRLKAERD